jgi:hypothetical protein
VEFFRTHRQEQTFKRAIDVAQNDVHAGAIKQSSGLPAFAL